MPLKGGAVGVAESPTILAQYGMTGDLGDVLKQIMKKIPKRDSMMTYQYEKANVDLHYIVKNKLVFICANQRKNAQTQEKRLPFAYLEDIKTKFLEKYGSNGNYPDLTSLPSESKINAEFSKVLELRMTDVQENDKINMILKETEKAKDLAERNIEDLLERGEKLEKLEQDTEALHTEARTFKSGSGKLKNKMKWRNRRMIIAIVGLVLLVILVIVIAVVASN